MRKIIKIIILILNIIAIALFFASTLAGTVSPSKFIGFSLLCYGYLYFLICNIIFIIFWLIVSSRWFLISLAAILIRFSFIPLYFQIGGSDKLSSAQDVETIKILNFNTHHFHGVDMRSELGDSNMNCFLEIIDNEKPDVLALQEYIGRGDTVHLTELLRDRGYKYMASGYESESMTGEVIFSRLPIIRTVRIEGPSKLYTNLLWNEDTLRLYCIHLNSYGLDDSDHQQIHNISHGNVDSLTGRSTLNKFCQTIKKHEKEWNILQPYFDNHQYLSIVAGDFNDPPASYFYQKCSKYMKDSYCEAGQGFSTTYHGVFTKRRNTTFPAFRIDMIMHTSDLTAVTYKRIKSEISDHYPVIATLSKKNTSK